MSNINNNYSFKYLNYENFLFFCNNSNDSLFDLYGHFSYNDVDSP